MELYLHFNLIMARSPGFGSIATDFIRALNTRFPYASGTEYLKLASYHNSPDRSTKSTTPPINGLCLLVSTRFQVLFHSPPGVLFTIPSRYYPLSVTGGIQAYRVVPADSQQISRARCYSGTNATNRPWLSRTGLSPSTAGDSTHFPLTTTTVGAQLADHARINPTTPHTQPLPGITRMRFSLIRVRSPLLTESQLFSLPTGTEMFHFPA